MPTLEPGTLEYVLVPITQADTGAGSLPTEITLVPDGLTLDPDAATWYPCDQADDGTVQVLVGTGGTIDPAPGTYTVYARVTATPERPVLRAGPITIL